MSTDPHDSDHWLLLAQAAEALGITTLNVLMHIKRGLLTGEEHEGGWLVDPDSLAALIHKRREGAVPEVCKSGCARMADGCGSCS